MKDAHRRPRLTLAECGPRDFVILARGVSYRHATPGVGLTFTFDRLRWRYDELHCELTVTSSLLGTQTVNGDVINQENFNVSSGRGRAERANRIVGDGNQRDVPVARLLEEACQNVLSAERAATTSVSLHDVQDDDEIRLFARDGLQIELDQTNMFYGLPGSAKSLEAERFALEAVKDGRRVGYVDFEWAPGPHKKRARLMYGAAFPDVRYLRLDRPLAHEIDSLRRTSITEGWDFAVIDSVSFGVDGPPESAEVASRFLQCCRQLRHGVLLVAHQTKAEGGDKYPFGSVMWYAGARNIYHFRRSNSEQDQNVLVAAVTHRKSNADRLRAPVALEYTFSPERISVQQVNAAAIEDIAQTLSVRHRLRYTLQAGPRKVEDVATELEVKPNTIVQTVIRDEENAKKGKVRQFIRLTDMRVALFEQRSA